jgi:hypothetical protein
VKRTVEFVRPVGSVPFTLPSGCVVHVPVVPGILKHPRVEELPRLLSDAAVLEKYTMEVLRKAPWPVVREFPRELLLGCLDKAPLTEGRRRALRFMLGV